MAGGNYSLGTAEGLIRIGYDGSGATQAQKGFDEVEKSAGRSAATLDRVGHRSAVAGGLIAAGIAFATTKAIDFEKQISAIGAVSGATQPQMDALRQKALQLGADTSFSASQAAQAMEELAKAGISLPDILNGAADATVALAAAGGIELPEAATIAANAMNSFGLTAKELPGVVNLIAGAANASAIDVGQFGQSMQQAGAVAHLAGVPFSELAVAIAEMGNAGIKGSDAGTSLKTFLQNLIPQTKEQTTLMKDLGLITEDGANKFFDASGKVKNLADVSQLLQDSLKGMSKEQQVATLQTLFGSDAIRAAAVLTEQGASGFNNLAGAMGKTSAADVAAARLNNTAGQMEQLKGSAETAAISFGSVLLPKLTQLAQALTGLGNWLSGLSPKWQSIVVDSTGAAAALLLTVAAVAKIVNTIELISGAVTAIKAWTVWTNIASFATKAWAAANAILSISILGTPLGWILLAIVAIIAVVILVIKYHKEIGAWIASVWGKFLDFVRPVTDFFAGPFANFFISAWNMIKAAWNEAVGFFQSIWNGIMVGINFVLSVVQSVVGFFAPLFQAAFSLIVAVIQTAWAIISAIFAVAATIFDATVGASFRALWALAQLVFNGIMSVITTVFNFLAPYIFAIWSGIVSFLSGLWSGIVSIATSVWSGLSSFFSGLWSGISSVASGVWNAIMGFLSGIWDTIVNTARLMWIGLQTTLSSVWNAIVGVVRSAVNQVIAVMNTIRSIVTAVGNFFGELKNAAEGGVGSLFSFVSGIPGRILGALGNIGSLLYNAGADLVRGLINGIESMFGWLVDKAASLGSSAVNAAKKAIGISSPSTKFAEIGRFSVEGFALGLIRNSDIAVSAVERVFAQTSAVAFAQAPDLGTVTATLAPNSLLSAGATTTVTVTGTTVNVPATVVDPEQIAKYAAGRIGTSVATAVTGLG